MSVRFIFSLSLALMSNTLFAMENTQAQTVTMSKAFKNQAIALGDLVSLRPQKFVEELAPIAQTIFANEDLINERLALKKLCDAHVNWHRGEYDVAGKKVVKAVALLNHL